MDYISDMSSEARPRSLPAVVVKAGLAEGDTHASLACGADGLWTAGRRGDDRGQTAVGEPQPPCGCMQNVCFFSAFFLKFS